MTKQARIINADEGYHGFPNGAIVDLDEHVEANDYDPECYHCIAAQDGVSSSFLGMSPFVAGGLSQYVPVNQLQFI